VQRSSEGGGVNLYDELYEAWKREKENVEIQRVPKDFYRKLAEYVKKIREERRMLDKNTTKAKLLKHEFRNAKNMVGDLIRLRYDKALKKSLTRENVPRDVLTQEEEKLYGEILPLAEAYQGFLKNVLRGRLSYVDREEKKSMVVLRFVQEIPALVGSDMKTYGPFEPEDIATLPAENARILIKQGVALEVEIK
jgi:DNA replication factor GINS